MKKLILSLAAYAGALCMLEQIHAQSPQPSAADLTGKAILEQLRTQQGEELNQFISLLTFTFDKSKLKDEEIDPIIEQLHIIQRSDTYQKAVPAFKDPAGRKITIFPNRRATDQCIFGFQFEKLANSLRRLPLDQRVEKIVEQIEHPPKGFHFTTDDAFAGELIRAGRDAVPFIIQHKPKQPSHRRLLVGALATIGDPRAIDYIIDVLDTPGDAFRLERPIAADALAKFNDKRVIAALVKALGDETYVEVDRHLPQQVATPGHQPYVGRYYSVQHAAAKSLASLTAKDWGWLYNEDDRTWSTWLASEQPDTFIPARLQRTDDEIANLIEHLFHRYMSGRPNPWQPENALATAIGIQNLSQDLKQLGTRVVPVFVNAYLARVKETPLWERELQQWTNDLLHALEWSEATEAAEKLHR